MILVRQLRLVCPHLVHNRQKARKHGIDRLSIQLREVLIFTLVCLKESGFDLCGSLVTALKPHPGISSSSTIRDPLKLGKQKTQKENTTSLAICVVLVNLLLTDNSSKHHVVRILTNLLDPPVYALKMSRHADLPAGVVCSIEEWRLAETTLHVAFVDHRPLWWNDP
jgi:hypothetical protein